MSNIINPNLAPVSKMSIWSGIPYEQNGFEWILDKNAVNGGLRFEPNGLTVGETYTISYLIQKKSGALKTIRGHCQEGFSVIKWSIDGVQQNHAYNSNDTTPNVADDDIAHRVVFTGVYKASGSQNGFFIQPNRMQSVPVEFAVWNFKVEVGSEATTWIPAEEDIPIESPVSMTNPYWNINFNDCLKIPSFTHAHGENQSHFDKMVAFGYKFMPISNYYPSKPTDASKFENVPDDVIITPNAEHHNMLISNAMRGNMHICSLGSFYESGNPKGTSPVGVNAPWQKAFKGIISKLKYKDAGGITINHPNWSNDNDALGGFDTKFWCELLDYDSDKVLGIEVYNTSSERSYGNGYDLDTWDEILKTGRRCWGFVTPDWDVVQNGANGFGKCVLLLDTFNEHEALKAFRNGNFYGQKLNSDLAFTNIRYFNDIFIVNTVNANKIVVIEDGVRTEYDSSVVYHPVNSNAVYVRAEAFSADDEIYSNPIILKPRKAKKKVADDFLFLY